MALFRKFKTNYLAFALLTAMAAQNSHAISLQPIEVLSSPNELLYAEIRFTGANTSESMTVNAASPEDLASLGISEPINAENLNFYSRSNNYGDGVITITSNKPLNVKELNVVLKINQGKATRLQHVRTPLKPTLTKEQIANNERNLTPTVVSENDLKLNLPEATGATENVVAVTKPSTTTQPVVSTISKPTEKPTTAQAQPVKPTEKPTTAQAQPVKPTEKPTTTQAQPIKPTEKPTTTQAQPVKPTEKPTTAQAQPVKPTEKPTTAQAQPVKPANTLESKSQQMLAQGGQTVYKSEFLVIQRTLRLPNGQVVNNDIATKPTTPSQTTAPTTQPQQHVVQKNESLWSIAQSIATQTSQPVGQVMQQIKQNNPNAFVNGNASLLRQGATLNVIIAPAPSSETSAKDAKATAKSTSSNKTNKPAPQAKAPIKASKPVPKAKPQASRQAQVSIIAESKHDSAHGSAKAGSGNNASSANLNAKVMQAREKTLNTQRNVSNIAGDLKSKNQKLKIINARLAQLEQQLNSKPAPKAQ